MPIPQPNPGEKQADFMSRCMGNETMNKEYPDQKQRAAVCGTQWRRREMQEWINGLTLADSAKPKDEIMLFPFGQFKHPQYGKMNFDKKFFEQVIKNYKEKVLGITPFIDKEHAMGEAYGWLNEPPYIKEGQGLFVKPEWTEQGEQILSQKTYKYLSPWFEDFKDPMTGKIFKNTLRGAALTNIPFLKVMPSVIKEGQKLNEPVNIQLSELSIFDSTESEAKTEEPQGEVKAEEIQATTKNLEENTMQEEKNVELGEDMKKKMAALEAENAKLKKELEDIKNKKMDDKSDNEIAVKLSEAETKLEETTKRLNELECEKIVGSAVGVKILLKDKDYWMEKFMSDPDGVKKDIEHLAPVVDTQVHGSGGGETDTDTDPGMKIKRLAEEKVNKSNGSLSLSDAIAQVCNENSDLANAYAETEYKGDKK